MIGTAYSYAGADQSLVTAFQALGTSAQGGAYWSDPSLSNLKSRLKTFYIHEQGIRCCYCNRHMASNNHRIWDIEHVVARGKYPRFLFEPLNLAASCPDCNTAKGDSEALVANQRRRKSYPNRSSDYQLIHPHFDTFEQHIYQNGMVFLPKTPKGKKTIYVCDLLRFAQKYIAWDNSATDTSFEEDVEIVFSGQSDALAVVDEMISGLATPSP